MKDTIKRMKKLLPFSPAVLRTMILTKDWKEYQCPPIGDWLFNNPVRMEALPVVYAGCLPFAPPSSLFPLLHPPLGPRKLDFGFCWVQPMGSLAVGPESQEGE